MRGTMDFRVLGPLEVHDEGEPLRLGSPKQRSLLAVLLLRANAVVSRDAAIDAVWDDDPPERAPEALQVYIHGLRKVLGHERIELRGTGYLLHVASGELDLDRFERLVAQGRYAEALELWRGEPLADVELDAPERARLAELRLRTLELDADARLALGEHDDLIPELEALVAEEPLREAFRRPADALALPRRPADGRARPLPETRRLLADELGLEPSPALRRAGTRRSFGTTLPSDQAPKRKASFACLSPRPRRRAATSSRRGLCRAAATEVRL